MSAEYGEPWISRPSTDGRGYEIGTTPPFMDEWCGSRIGEIFDGKATERILACVNALDGVANVEITPQLIEAADYAVRMYRAGETKLEPAMDVLERILGEMASR